MASRRDMRGDSESPMKAGVLFAIWLPSAYDLLVVNRLHGFRKIDSFDGSLGALGSLRTRCRGGNSQGRNESELSLPSQSGTTSTVPMNMSTNSSRSSGKSVNSSFEKLIWSPDFADRGYDPLFMDGLSPAEAEYARSEWLKQVNQFSFLRHLGLASR